LSFCDLNNLYSTIFHQINLIKTRNWILRQGIRYLFNAQRRVSEIYHNIFDYIERFYNARRQHSTLGYVSPMQFEAEAC